MKLLAALLLAGCYAQHEAEPCDAGEDYGRDAGPARDLCLEPCGTQRSAGTGGGLPHRSPNGWCEGPYVGCIAPGSPLSSTWEGRP